MADIKSAHEIAQEKIAAIGEVTEEERLRWKYIPQGEKLAAEYLEGKLNLVEELSKQEKKAQTYIKKGAEKALLANIGLPKDEQIKNRNEKTMGALMQIKENKKEVGAVFEKISHILSHYDGQGEQQRQQAYQSLKYELGSKLQQAVEQQMGKGAGLGINVESLPQFKEEWQRVLAHLDAGYLKMLDEALSKGITAVADGYVFEEDLQAWQELKQEGKIRTDGDTIARA